MRRKYVLLASDGTSHDLSRRAVFSATMFDLPDLLDQGWRPVREVAVGQDRQPGHVEVAGGQLALLVGGLGEGDRLGRPPGWVGRDRAEGAEEVAE